MKNLTFAFPLLLLCITGCASTLHRAQDVSSSLTNLQTGEVIELVMGKTTRNRSEILRSSTSASGEAFTGEFSTSGRSNLSTGVSAGYYSGGGWSVGLDLVRWLGANQTGHAIIRGDKGTIIDVSYTASRGGITGEGSDNAGNRYRFTCCEPES